MTPLNWIMAAALRGSPADGPLHSLRAGYENSLQSARDDLESKRVAVEQLDAALDVGADQDSGADSINVNLGAARVLFETLARNAWQAVSAVGTLGFRRGLMRPAETPNQIENGTVFGLAIFVEGGINGGFFTNAHMTAEPLSALMLSLLIAAANVNACALAGHYLGRFFNYGANAADADAPAFKNIRTRAKAGAAVFAVVMAYFHLLVGAVREQETLTGIEHSVDAYLRVFTTPESFWLVMIGVCMSVFAWCKAKGGAFDDPEPGYGAAQRAADKAMATLEVEYETTGRKIDGPFVAALKAIDDEEKQHRKKLAEYNKKCADYRTTHSHVKGLIRSAESQLKAEVAVIANHHLGARGRRERFDTQSIPEGLVSFGDLEPGQPQFSIRKFDGSRFAARRRAVEDARAQAHAALTRLFEESIQNAKKGDSL